MRVADDHFAVYHSSSEGNETGRPLMNVKQKFALTLLTGVASGLTAGIAIHAQQVKPAPGYFVAGLEITVSFPKIPSDLNWHDEVESLHR